MTTSCGVNTRIYIISPRYLECQPESESGYRVFKELFNWNIEFDYTVRKDTGKGSYVSPFFDLFGTEDPTACMSSRSV